MRTIDADHVTSMLHEYVKREQSYIDIGNNRSVATGHRNGLLEAIAQIDEEPTIELQRWIPVTERLPEECGEYLVTKQSIGWNCEEYDSVDIAYYDEDGRFHKANKIFAWMPLPEPYKGETE